MYKFGQIEIASKKFNSGYEVPSTVDVSKIRISDGIMVNKHDVRFMIGYEKTPGEIVPLYMKTPKNCRSSGVSRYNETSPWKMGFNVSEDEDWVKLWKSIWEGIEEALSVKLSGNPLNNGKYINPKLMVWDEDIKTRFNPCNRPEGPCEATGVLKISSIYCQANNNYLQVFLKECKYTKRDTSFESMLSSDEDEGYDTVF